MRRGVRAVVPNHYRECCADGRPARCQSRQSSSRLLQTVGTAGYTTTSPFSLPCDLHHPVKEIVPPFAMRENGGWATRDGQPSGTDRPAYVCACRARRM